MQEMQDFETGGMKWQDTLDSLMELSHVDSEKYLGQILSSDGTNTKNIQKIKNKGIGIQNKIIQMLDHMPAGMFHFEVAIILRNAYLISSILSSSEIWYDMKQHEYDQLEYVDQILIKNLFNCSNSVPSDLLFLELGLVPIKQIIQMRRCLYLHHLLNQNKNSLLFKFFMAQLENKQQGDWASQVLTDLENFQIHLELQEIQNMSNLKFKSLVKEKVIDFAFIRLTKRKGERKSENAKGRNLNYSELKMQEYFTATNTDISIEEKKWLFRCRVDDIEVKGNNTWKYEDISCYYCSENCPETQEHLLFCKTLLGSNDKVTYLPNYIELFEGDLEEQIYVTRLLKDNFDRSIV